MTMQRLSVIIPVLREQQRINQTIATLRRQAPAVEIIVVDGDPDGSTLQALSDPQVTKLAASAGRGSQLAAGIRQATNDGLLLLHADTLLPDNGLQAIAAAFETGAAWGAFRLGIAAPGAAYRVIERCVDLRCRLFNLPYGDQAIFVTRAALRAAGGMPALPLMEDVALCRQLTRAGQPFALLPPRVQTSARRWQQDGIVRRTLRNWWLLLRYLNGADPARLAEAYR